MNPTETEAHEFYSLCRERDCRLTVDEVRHWHDRILSLEQRLEAQLADCRAEQEESRIIFEDSTKVVRSLRQRLETAAEWLRHVDHLRGCMEPHFVEDDCICGLRELRAALAAGEDEEARRDMFGRTHPKTAGEMNPDTLKAQLASWRNRFISTEEFAECVTKCADAWGNDIMANEGLSKRLTAANQQVIARENDALRQRLEAVKALAGENFDSLTIERKLNAALAAGESAT